MKRLVKKANGLEKLSYLLADTHLDTKKNIYNHEDSIVYKLDEECCSVFTSILLYVSDMIIRAHRLHNENFLEKLFEERKNSNDEERINWINNYVNNVYKIVKEEYSIDNIGKKIDKYNEAVRRNIIENEILSKFITKGERFLVNKDEFIRQVNTLFEKETESDIEETLKAFTETKAKLDEGAYKVAAIPDMANA